MDTTAFFRWSIGAHEGKLSMVASDNGNWYDPARYGVSPQRRGCGVLVGSCYGVTAYALVKYRVLKGVALATAKRVTAADIAAITLEQAVAIGVALYYVAPGFDKLTWNRATAALVDFGWGSGTGTATSSAQRYLGLVADASCGPVTAGSFNRWMARVGEAGAANIIFAMRQAHDQAVASNEGPTDPDRIFLPGWTNRETDFRPPSTALPHGGKLWQAWG